MEYKLKHPFNCIVAAPTKSGKTELVKKIVKYANEIIDPTPQKIYWCYSEWQPAYNEIKHLVQFSQGFNISDELKKDLTMPKLVIFDDLMHDMKNKSNDFT